MPNNNYISEQETLLRYAVAFENVESQKEIAEKMEEVGYDVSVIREGKKIFEETQKVYKLNKTEDKETSHAYNDFKAKFEELDDIYRIHRKKTKVIFRDDPQTLKDLSLTGNIPKAYSKWVEVLGYFYSELIPNTELQQKIARLKITIEQLTQAQNKLIELTKARAEYLKEKGESQAATKQKDQAFAKLNDWMSEFYVVARIALEDNPQLLEALGVVVRS